MALKDTIIGNGNICNLLEKSYKSGRLAHAYLFVGPDHMGKKTLAFNFGKMLLDSNDAIIEKNPDMIVVAPLEDKKEITVNQVRELEKELSFSPYLAKYKLAVIENAEKMTEEASNALLKTLEEPSKTTILILLTSDSNRILETIRSRCQIMKFLPVKKSELEEQFRKRTKNEVDLENLIELSGYKPGKIIELIENKELKNELIDELEYLSKIEERSSAERIEKAESMSVYNIEKLTNLLDVWVLNLRKRFISGNRQKDVGCGENVSKAARKINLITKTKREILTKNVNLRLALENLILEI